MKKKFAFMLCTSTIPLFAFKVNAQQTFDPADIRFPGDIAFTTVADACYYTLTVSVNVKGSLTPVLTYE